MKYIVFVHNGYWKLHIFLCPQYSFKCYAITVFHCTYEHTLPNVVQIEISIRVKWPVWHNTTKTEYTYVHIIQQPTIEVLRMLPVFQSMHPAQRMHSKSTTGTPKMTALWCVCVCVCVVTSKTSYNMHSTHSRYLTNHSQERGTSEEGLDFVWDT